MVVIPKDMSLLRRIAYVFETYGAPIDVDKRGSDEYERGREEARRELAIAMANMLGGWQDKFDRERFLRAADVR